MAKQNATVSAETQEMQDITSRLAEIDQERAELSQRLAELVGDSSGTTSRRRGSNRGKGKSSKSGKGKSQSSGRSQGRRSISEEGLSLKSHLVRDVLPDKSNKEGITVEDALVKLQEIGIHPGGEDPRTGVRQALQGLVNSDGFVERPYRGYFRLNKEGEREAKRLQEGEGEQSE